MPTATKTRLIDVKLDIAKADRERLVAILNQHLADTLDLQSQIKQAHWNVKGLGFQQVHLLFDDQAEVFEGFADMIAERVALLGGVAEGTVRMAAAASKLPEFPTDEHAVPVFLALVRDRVAAYAKSTRQAIEAVSKIDEPTTEDLLTEVSRGTDQQLYFLEAHLF
ncbi:MAG TPA: DNA starvation/stationary phase protection protein Dps [Trueperaceae bacterium]|nr:DNA starvation/stationary phase protection protein Dps [Trueperaceae bacterium]